MLVRASAVMGADSTVARPGLGEQGFLSFFNIRGSYVTQLSGVSQFRLREEFWTLLGALLMVLEGNNWQAQGPL